MLTLLQGVHERTTLTGGQSYTLYIMYTYVPIVKGAPEKNARYFRGGNFTIIYVVRLIFIYFIFKQELKTLPPTDATTANTQHGLIQLQSLSSKLLTTAISHYGGRG